MKSKNEWGAGVRKSVGRGSEKKRESEREKYKDRDKVG